MLADKRNEMAAIFRVNLLGNLKYTNEHLGNFFNTARNGGGKVMYLLLSYMRCGKGGHYDLNCSDILFKIGPIHLILLDIKPMFDVKH